MKSISEHQQGEKKDSLISCEVEIGIKYLMGGQEHVLLAFAKLEH